MLLPGFSEKPAPAGVRGGHTGPPPGVPPLLTHPGPHHQGRGVVCGPRRTVQSGGEPPSLSVAEVSHLPFPSRVADSSADLEGGPVRGPAPGEPPARPQHRPRPQRAQRWADARLGGLRRTPSSSPRGPALPGIFLNKTLNETNFCLASVTLPV